MRDKISNNKEQQIMDAAEEVFLEKGYLLATTTEIAKRAGVTHAMLHYYFRTKEHIFIKVLDKHVYGMIDALHRVMSRENPFKETVRMGISAFYDYLAANPKIGTFLYDVTHQCPELLQKYRIPLSSAATPILKFHKSMLESEIAKGNIRSITPVELLLDIVTLNISFFMALPVLENLFGTDEKTSQAMIARRKSEIIDLIMTRLYSK